VQLCGLGGEPAPVGHDVDRQDGQQEHHLATLRPGVSVEHAAETIGVLTAPGAWQAMVLDYGWSWDAAADWVAATAGATILR
jgi:hypothetical protein